MSATSPGTAAIPGAPGVVAQAPVAIALSLSNSSERGAKTRPPFQLCFTVPGVLGRSEVGAAHGLDRIVAGKFYSGHEAKVIEEIRQKRKAAGQDNDALLMVGRQTIGKGKELLESHRYGLYPRPIVLPPLGDRRLHFARHTSAMVRIQCQISRAQSLEGSLKTRLPI